MLWGNNMRRGLHPVPCLWPQEQLLWIPIPLPITLSPFTSQYCPDPFHVRKPSFQPTQSTRMELMHGCWGELGNHLPNNQLVFPQSPSPTTTQSSRNSVARYPPNTETNIAGPNFRQRRGSPTWSQLGFTEDLRIDFSL